VTERQSQIFMVIDEWWKKFGYAPSIDNIMSITGDRSRANVHRMMKRLCELGVCKRIPNKARSIRPVNLRVRDL
jgi:SOS-response transcriptional repressor LexA